MILYANLDGVELDLGVRGGGWLKLEVEVA